MSRKSITTIENFSNEFFVKVFDYLDGCHIYLAFADLNHRFQQLLNSPLVLFKINLDNWLSKEILNDYTISFYLLIYFSIKF